MALIFRSQFALISTYLPDSGKSERQYESALAELAVAVRLASSQYAVKSFVIAGDWNVGFSRAVLSADGDSAHCDDDVFGPNLPQHVDRRFCDRQDAVLAFCAQFSLVHGPSFLTDPVWSEAWTRKGWSDSSPLSHLDHVFISSNLKMSRWAPWPADSWHRERHRVWGDHRPFLWTVEARNTPRVFPTRGRRYPNLKGWAPLTPEALELVMGRLHDWAMAKVNSLLASCYRCASGLVDASGTMPLPRKPPRTSVLHPGVPITFVHSLRCRVAFYSAYPPLE